MSEPTPNKSKVTLEDLLRLKRHERPPAEYWARFDRELNERVWRALAQPVESRTSVFLGWFGRHTRGLTLGAFSTLAVVIAWFGQVQTPVKVASKGLAVRVASAINSAVKSDDAASASPAPNDNALTLATIAEHNLPSAAQPVLVAAKVLDATNPAGFHKVPALLAFATSEGGGVRYASDALSNPAFSAGNRGSAY